MKLLILAVLCISLAFARLEQNQQNPRFRSNENSNENSNSNESAEKSVSTENSDEDEKFYEKIHRSRDLKETVFRAGREYKYLYNGQVLTGLPGSSVQHSGSRIQAIATLQFLTDTRVLMKLSQIRMGRANADIPYPRQNLPFRVFEEIDIQSKLEKKLEKPVEFSYTNGLIHDLVLEGGELPWSANIKRAVLNMLQVNMKEKNRVETEEHQILNQLRQDSSEVTPRRSRYFRVHETSIEGDCDTVYEIGRRPNEEIDAEVPVLNVTKSIDFESCSKRPEIKYNWRFQDDCPTCEPKYNDEDEVIKSSTVVKFNITGTRDSFMIESAEGESQYTFVPMTEEANVVNTYVKKWLQIISSGPIESRIPQLSQPFPSDSDMIYSMEWDEWKEKFFMDGDNNFQQKTPYAQIPKKAEIVRELLKKLVVSVSDKIDQDATHIFTRLVTVLRLATRAEIEEIHQQLYEGQSDHFTPEEQQKIKEFLVSGMALAGTRDSISHLVKKIRTRQVSPLTAALALRELMNVRTVSTGMIAEVKSLCKEAVAEENFALRQSCWLAVGNMLDAMCDDNEDQLALETKMSTEQLCPTAFKTQMVQELFSELKRRESWEDQMIMIKTIANAGLDLGVFELEKIIYNGDKRYPTFLRIEAIMALKNLRDDMPRKIRKLLMPIYMNPREYPEVRMTALYELMNTFPERAILELIAKNINSEPSKQVASFAYSYLNTLANSTNPCYQNMTGDLKLALRFTRPVQPGIQYSKLIHLPFYNEYLESGVDVNFAHIMSNLSLIPSHAAFSVDTTFLGSWNRYLLTMGFGTEGLEPILAKLFRSEMFQSGFEDLFDRNPRHIDTLPYAKELREIFSSLKIKSRDYNKQTEPKGWAYLKFKGQEVGFAPITKSFLGELLATSGAKLQQMEEKLRRGLPINILKATILQESEMKFPTTLGLPIVYKHKIPAIFGANGKIQLERNADGFALNFDVKPSLAISSTHSIEIWSPIVNSGLKIRSAARAFTPLKGKFALDIKKFEVKMAFEPLKAAKEIFVAETKPISYVQVWPKSFKTWEEAEEKTIMGEEFDRVITYDRSYGKKFLGVELKVKGRLNAQPYYKLSGTPVWPFSGPNKVSLVLSPTSSAPEEILIKMSGKVAKPIEDRTSVELRDYHFKDQSDSESSSESDETSAEAKQKRKSNSQSNSDESISFEQSGEVAKKTKKGGEKSSESTEAFSQVDTAHLRQNELTVEMTTRGAVKRQASFTVAHKYSVGLRYNKIAARFQRSPIPGDEQPWTLCFNSEMIYPKKPVDVEEAKLKKVVATAQLKWGENCQSTDKQIAMKLQAERSNTQAEDEKDMDDIDECRYYEQKGIKSPVSCHSKVAKYAELMKYKVELNYENVPAELRNVTDKLFRFAKYQYYWHTEVASAMVNNPRGQVVVKLTIDPDSYQRVNITVKTPRENVTMRYLPMPFKLAPLNSHRSIVSSYLNDLTNDKFEPICKVNDVRIRTFDGVRYEVPISTCYSVLAKDCSAENNFAVLMKKITENSEEKKLKIITPRHKIQLTAGRAAGDIKVELNDQEYNVETGGAVQENGEVVAIIEEEGNYLKVHLIKAGVKVYFDGYAVHIKASPVYMHRQCGLCGHFDSETRMESEFLGPNNQHNTDVRQFYLDYIVADQHCTAPQKDSVCKDSRCQYESDWETQEEYDDDVYHRSPERKERQTKPVMTTDVIEELSRTCFSLNPVAECPEGSYPVDYKITKNVEYRCLHNSDPRVIDLQNHSEMRSVTKYLSNIRDSITRKIRQPTSCRRF